MTVTAYADDDEDEEELFDEEFNLSRNQMIELIHNFCTEPWFDFSFEDPIYRDGKQFTSIRFKGTHVGQQIYMFDKIYPSFDLQRLIVNMGRI